MNSKITLFLISLLSSINIHAQVGIGTTTPDSSAILDINSSSRGVLIPRIALTGTNDISTISLPSESLLIYNTATAGAAPDNVDPGFYYWDGINWVRIGHQPDKDWLQPDDSNPYSVNDNLYTNGNVGIGITPTNKLDVDGYIEVGDENSTGTANVEGAMRYNSSLKCMQFYDGNSWECIGQPKIQTHYIRDGINEYQDGSGSNIVNWNTNGYGYIHYFNVSNVQQGRKILFLVEMTVGTGDKRANGAYSCSWKIYGNGVWGEKHVPAVGSNENYTSFVWGTPSTSGFLNFAFEANIHYADVKITTIQF